MGLARGVLPGAAIVGQALFYDHVRCSTSSCSCCPFIMHEWISSLGRNGQHETHLLPNSERGQRVDPSPPHQNTKHYLLIRFDGVSRRRTGGSQHTWSVSIGTKRAHQGFFSNLNRAIPFYVETSVARLLCPLVRSCFEASTWKGYLRNSTYPCSEANGPPKVWRTYPISSHK